MLLLPFLSTVLLANIALAVPQIRRPPRPPGRRPPTGSTKYFQEAGGTLVLSHYDSRYFKGLVPYEEHRGVLRNLIRSYLVTCRERGVETWIAHGTLLGWWWNGSIMPWDYDLDVQVTDTTMQWLADNMNMTEYAHSFEAQESPQGGDGALHTIHKRYLLDINPHHSDLDRGDGQNIIDGRWIDMDNGMFIDLTALREREKHLPGVWSCKDRHRYGSQDLWPMRVTEFEGVAARIPYSFEKILTDEYGMNSLVLEEFEGHRWDRDIREWVKMTDEDKIKSKAAATERKKAELAKQGRLQ